jgi:hypothetical protein
MSTEGFKGGVHFVVGGFAGACLLYNLMRFAETRERRNLVNIGAYAALLGLEAVNTRHHWGKDVR